MKMYVGITDYNWFKTLKQAYDEVNFSILPSSLAWEAFGIANGARSLTELHDRIYKYKKTNRLSDPDPEIGCIILSMPFYFDEQDWIPVPHDWKRNIVQGKTYSTGEMPGMALYKQVQDKLRLPRVSILIIC